jgi:peptidyl-prolyl cis-trans isomerase SurA
MPVQQTQARHILLKSSTVMTDDVARQRLLGIRQRIVQGGESFGDLARRFSNDTSAPQGGDLGWLNPGETVPPFEKAMNALKIGEVSEPEKSPFGWHLILVEGRRTQDMADQYLRNQVRQRLFIQRSDAEFEAWLQRVRNLSFIDNRLEKTERLNRN